MIYGWHHFSFLIKCLVEFTSKVFGHGVFLRRIFMSDPLSLTNRRPLRCSFYSWVNFGMFVLYGICRFCSSIIFLLFSHVRLFVTPWTVAHQAPPPMGFPRQEFWSGLLFPSPEYLPDPGIESESPSLAGQFFTDASPGKPWWLKCLII